jgi:hypothetical protein
MSWWKLGTRAPLETAVEMLGLWRWRVANWNWRFQILWNLLCGLQPGLSGCLRPTPSLSDPGSPMGRVHRNRNDSVVHRESRQQQRCSGSWCFLVVSSAPVYFGSCFHHQWRKRKEGDIGRETDASLTREAAGSAFQRRPQLFLDGDAIGPQKVVQNLHDCPQYGGCLSHWSELRLTPSGNCPWNDCCVTSHPKTQWLKTAAASYLVLILQSRLGWVQ